jgi:iron complex transport system ATP-binding protein
MIELKNIFAGYGNKTILQDVSASFKQGEFTSIIGVNGCGKSTLLKTILGILPTTKGSVIIDNTPISNMTKNNIAQKVSYLAQGKNRPDITVERLVLHGRFPYLNYPRRYSRKDREIALSAMEKVGILELADRPLNTLSGGMLQNVYIAMALAQDTDYIALDEPTTYLDVSHQLKLMRLLKALVDTGKGIIVVMHDLPLAMTFSDKILLLDKGAVANYDTPKNIYDMKIIEKRFDVEIEYFSDRESYSYKY